MIFHGPRFTVRVSFSRYFPLETEEETGEKDYLNVLGKRFSIAEQEFFTFEKKDLELIKKAVETTSKKIPPK